MDVPKGEVRTIGLISDTHGLVRPEALAALDGSDIIIHAGDIGGEQVLQALQAIGPVLAVRGNNDRGPWAEKIPSTRTLIVGRVWLYIVHDITDYVATDLHHHVVITGHSHRPAMHERDGVLYINPGSAGPRRFKLPVSVATLDVRHDRPHVTFIELTGPKITRAEAAWDIQTPRHGGPLER